MTIPVGFGQVNFRYAASNAIPNGAECTLGFVVGPTSPADDALVIGGYWAASIVPQQTNAATFVEAHVKWGPTATGPDASVTFNVTGGKGGDPFGAQVSALVQKRTAIGGRHGRGRLFLPALTEGLISDGSHLQGAYRSDIQAAFNAFLNSMNASLRYPVVLRGDAGVPAAITLFNVEAMLATQRRRLRG
jgi:hypothetical protein